MQEYSTNSDNYETVFCAEKQLDNLKAQSFLDPLAVVHFSKGMHEVVRQNNCDLLRHLIQKGFSTEVQDQKGRTLLGEAVLYRAYEAACCLIEAGADLRAVDRQGACIFNLWVQGVSYPEKADAAGIRFNREAYQKVERLLLERGAYLDINRPDDLGRTALMIAAGNAPGLIERLIEKGAHVNRADKKGKTPLMYALSSANEQAIDLLIRHGANLFQKNEDGLSACDMAQHMSGRIAQAFKQALERYFPDDMRLIQAAGAGDKTAINNLLKKGIDLRFKDAQGRSAVQAALDGGHFEIARHLMHVLEKQACLQQKQKRITFHKKYKKKIIGKITSEKRHERHS